MIGHGPEQVVKIKSATHIFPEIFFSVNGWLKLSNKSKGGISPKTGNGSWEQAAKVIAIK